VSDGQTARGTFPKHDAGVWQVQIEKPLANVSGSGPFNHGIKTLLRSDCPVCIVLKSTHWSVQVGQRPSSSARGGPQTICDLKDEVRRRPCQRSTKGGTLLFRVSLSAPLALRNPCRRIANVAGGSAAERRCLYILVRPARIELAAPRLGGGCSIR
jgi:hypothetical protein